MKKRVRTLPYLCHVRTLGTFETACMCVCGVVVPALLHDHGLTVTKWNLEKKLKSREFSACAYGSMACFRLVRPSFLLIVAKPIVNAVGCHIGL